MFFAKKDLLNRKIIILLYYQLNALLYDTARSVISYKKLTQ